uniref:Uncharacterized protein n=1 Tax=Daphnia magna TaxID=35525 RepID=A0A0P4XNC4_9CRUS
MVQGGLHLLYSLYVYVSGFALPPVLFCLLSRLRSSPPVHFPHSFSLDPLFFFYFFTSIFVMDELSLRWPLLTISFLHTCCPHTHTQNTNGPLFPRHESKLPLRLVMAVNDRRPKDLANTHFS